MFRKSLITLLAILFSGISWYLSNGLRGDFWFLIWIAPVPVLILSFKSSGKRSFVIAYLSYLIGRLSWYSYLVSVTFLVPAIIITLLLPLIFAFIVVVSRWVVIKTGSWISIFAFPAFFTSYEFILMMLSYDGTAGSIAYSQSNLVPLIQIASVTGILGITFLITLVPSALAGIWYYRQHKKVIRYAGFATLFILMSVFMFGFGRIRNNSVKETVKAGVIVLEENMHNMSGLPDIEKEKQCAGNYAKKVSLLAALGAKVILLPERAVDMRNETGQYIISALASEARTGNIDIISGYSNFRNNRAHNSAMVINGEGRTIADYDKVHLVRGLETQFVPGNKIGLFRIGQVSCGVAVCKDLDYPEYIREYGKSDISILFVPAWDFVKDDWLHSRMAVLRGVENGFSEVRGARLGKLTISDCFGRVTSEAASSDRKESVLSGEVSLLRQPTIYSKFGDWFGIAGLIAAVSLILISLSMSEKVRRWISSSSKYKIE
jgi:apolipoprotein N-acyltransferase